jgi:hypothetical protein
MVDERPRLAASEIEEELLAELQKLPSLRDTQSVRIRPYSGPKLDMGAGQDRAGSGADADQVCRPGDRRRSAPATIRPRSQPSAASLRIPHVLRRTHSLPDPTSAPAQSAFTSSNSTMLVWPVMGSHNRFSDKPSVGGNGANVSLYALTRCR